MKKITSTGQPCRHCGVPVVRCTHKSTWEPEQKNQFYFEWWFQCPQCHTTYMAEEAKRWIGTAAASVDGKVLALAAENETRLKLDCFFDGACGPQNPGGTASWGFLIKSTGKLLASRSGIVGTGPAMTSNVAEISACAHLIAHLLENYQDATEIWIHGDSRIVIRALSGQGRKTPAGRYAPYVLATIPLVAKLRARCPKTYFMWIPREQNAEADRLADFGNAFVPPWLRHAGYEQESIDEEYRLRLERED